MHRRLVICIFMLLLIGIFTETGRSEQRQTWALCFDVNPLEYALGDEFEQALMDGGWRNSHVNVVTTDSRHAFLNGLHWLQSVAHSEDTVIFYFSGHGYTGGMGIGSEAVSYASLDDELDKVACRGMFIILDSCHSGSAIPMLEETGRVILTSCGSGEISGYFSEAVISALSVAADCNGNNDGSVSAEEIASYVMSDWNIEQYSPQVEDGYEGNMSLLTTLWGNRAAEVFQVYGQQTMQMFTDDRWLRQSFVPVSTPLRGVYLKIAKWKNASALQVAVYNHTGSLLQHVSIPANSLPHINDIPIWIPIDLHVNVTPGKIHYLVCSGTNSTGWWWNSTDQYMDGEADVSFDCGASWHPLSNTDLSFILFGEADSTPPQVTLLQPIGDEVITGVRLISWHAIDNNDNNLNGSISLYASRDGGQSWTLVAEGIKNSGQFTWDSRLNKDGTAYMLKVTAVDSSGNIGMDTSNRVFIVDNSPPDSGYSLYPTPSKRHNGWYTSGVTMSITATDTASGVNRSIYRIDGGAWSEYYGEFIVEEDGEHIIQFYSVDNAQQVEAQKNVGINIDTTQPVSTHESVPPIPEGDNGWHRGGITVSIKAQDRTSGVESVWYTVDEGNRTMYTESIAITEDGVHTVCYNSIDRAGNEETVQSASFKIDGEAPNVGFLRPLDGFLYVMGREILPLKQTVILGRATVEVDAFDDTAGVDRVEFYIDSNLYETVATHPFTMVWDERVWFDYHTIKAVAYDTAGNMAVAEQDIWIFNL